MVVGTNGSRRSQTLRIYLFTFPLNWTFSPNRINMESTARSHSTAEDQVYAKLESASSTAGPTSSPAGGRASSAGVATGPTGIAKGNGAGPTDRKKQPTNAGGNGEPTAVSESASSKGEAGRPAIDYRNEQIRLVAQAVRKMIRRAPESHRQSLLWR